MIIRMFYIDFLFICHVFIFSFLSFLCVSFFPFCYLLLYTLVCNACRYEMTRNTCCSSLITYELNWIDNICNYYITDSWLAELFKALVLPYKNDPTTCNILTYKHVHVRGLQNHLLFILEAGGLYIWILNFLKSRQNNIVYALLMKEA